MSAIRPGGTIGIIGGGQLAQMLIFEGHRMGYQFAVMDPDPEAPAMRIAEFPVKGALDDVSAAKTLAQQSDVVTLDTEHVPAELLEEIESLAPVRPGASVFHIIQDRLNQRRFLSQNNLPQARNAGVTDAESLRHGPLVTGFPCILKSRRLGYDGKGQALIKEESDLLNGWDTIGQAPAVLESFVDFDREISVLLARGLDGEIRFHPMAENIHKNHILHTTRVPADISASLMKEAHTIGARIAEALGHVGMMAIELFLTRDGALLVNEIAPRTHNSGHYTLGACATSQFEQHLRAVCGLPLGDAALLKPAVMLNLLGDLWQNGDPDWNLVLSHPNTRLHLYGKKRALPGRKMGHVLVMDDDTLSAHKTAETIFQALSSNRGAALKK